MRRGLRVKWVRAPEQSRSSLFGAEANVFAQDCRACDALVLDDFGADHASDVWRTWLEDVLDARWGSKRKTLITVNNLDGPEFSARIGGRIVDRLRDGSRLDCGKGSMRGELPKPTQPEAP